MAWRLEDNPWLDAPLEVARPRAECSLRRIWEVSPDALALVMAVLLRREEVEALLTGAGEEDLSGFREDALRLKAVARCTSPCAFAEAVEDVLDGMTHDLRRVVARCPMMDLAAWWSEERDRAGGEELAALLWQLSRDSRPYLEHLTTRVQGDLLLQALRLLRERRALVRGSAYTRPNFVEGPQPQHLNRKELAHG